MNEKISQKKYLISSEQSKDYNNPTNDSNYNLQYHEVPYRFIILISYFLLTFSNGLQWVTFSSCADNFSKNYGIPSYQVNLFSLMYMIIYPFVCIPEGFLIDSYSTKLGITLASFCTILGGFLKIFLNKNKLFAFGGQFFAGLFQPAIINSPGKIAATWFRDDMRNLITTICCLSDTIGILIGFIFHLPFVDENKTGDDYKNDFEKYLKYEFLLILIFCFPSLVFFKNKPKIPPSPSQEIKNKEKINESENIKENLKTLFTNIQFIYLLIPTFFIVGYYCIYGTIINSYFKLYDISDSQSSIIYSVSCIIGMISSIIFSILLDKYKRFKLFMLFLGIFGFIFQFFLTIFLEIFYNSNKNTFYIAFIFYSLVNLMVVPFYTIGMNYACEITYPIGESLTGGIMMSMSQFSGIGGTFLCDWMINNLKKKYLTNLLLLGFFFISIIFILLFKEKLKRQEIDDEIKNRVEEEE